MRLHLISGPTCSGKTGVAVACARQTGWPVISLDRVQCCPELATGSGRPSAADLAGTCRVYLTSRPLAEGIIGAEQAHRLLKRRVQDLRDAQMEGAILEGGSISLLNAIVADHYWGGGFVWQTTRFQLGDPAAFLRRARQRIEQMLESSASSRSLLDELALLWPQVGLREKLEDIDGYRVAIRLARERGMSPIELSKPLAVGVRAELIERIALDYLEHAQRQQRDLPTLTQAWLKRPAEFDAGGV